MLLFQHIPESTLACFLGKRKKEGLIIGSFMQRGASDLLFEGCSSMCWKQQLALMTLTMFRDLQTPYFVRIWVPGQGKNVML